MVVGKSWPAPRKGLYFMELQQHSSSWCQHNDTITDGWKCWWYTVFTFAKWMLNCFFSLTVTFVRSADVHLFFFFFFFFLMCNVFNVFFSSFAGSTSSSTSDHWLVRLAGGSKRGSVVSGGPVHGPMGPLQAPESPELPVFRDEPSKTVETSRYLGKQIISSNCPDKNMKIQNVLSTSRGRVCRVSVSMNSFDTAVGQRSIDSEADNTTAGLHVASFPLNPPSVWKHFEPSSGMADSATHNQNYEKNYKESLMLKKTTMKRAKKQN